MTRPQIVNTGSGYFIVKKYVDLKFRNLSGDNVTIRFYCAPGLARDDKVEFLFGLSASIGLGYTGFQPQKNIIIKNQLSEYESINEEDFDSYDLFKNLQNSAELFGGKARTDINYEYLSLLVLP